MRRKIYFPRVSLALFLVTIRELNFDTVKLVKKSIAAFNVLKNRYLYGFFGRLIWRRNSSRGIESFNAKMRLGS